MSNDLYGGVMEDAVLELYELASGERSLQPEIKLMRALLAAELVNGADGNASYYLEMLVKAVRADTGPVDTALGAVLDRAAEEKVAGKVLAAHSARVEATPERAVPKELKARVKQSTVPMSGRPVSIGEAARMLGISERQVQRLVSSGKFTAKKSGSDKRKTLIPVSEVRAYRSD